MKKNASTIFLAVVWLLTVTILLCIPGTKLPKITWEDKIWFDKWIHVFLFMVLVILWTKVYAGEKNIHFNPRRVFFQIMIMSLIYGILMELVQKYFIPYRSFDVRDIVADGVGSFMGYLISIKRFIKTE